MAITKRELLIILYKAQSCIWLYTGQLAHDMTQREIEAFTEDVLGDLSSAIRKENSI